MKKSVVYGLLLLSFLLLFQGAFAADGTCGTNVTYTITDNTITFSKENSSTDAEWGPDCGEVFKEDPDITKVSISGTIIVTDGHEMFREFEYVQEMDLENLDVSNVTDMNSMFFGCYSLESLDVSSWNTSMVTDMAMMFEECSSLESLDVSGWDTSNVTDMSWMFMVCSSLESLDVSGWDTSNVTSMAIMFDVCSSLESLDVSGWDTGKVTNMFMMFANCSSLTSLDVSSWDTSKVESMQLMFGNCQSLVSLDVSGWDTSSVLSLAGMFYDCSALESLDVSGWDTSAVTDMEYMFYTCSSLTDLDVSGWNTSNVTNMSHMFISCNLLNYLDVSRWDTSKVTDMNSAFKRCDVMDGLDVSKWDTSSVTDMGSMFCGCYGMTALDVSGWDTSKVTTMRAMFSGDSLFTELNVSKWDTSKVTDMWAMFSGCSGLTELDVSKWDTSSLVNMTYLFVGCHSLEYLDLSRWDTSGATEMSDMFGLCYALTKLDLSGWDTSNIAEMDNAFRDCVNLRTITFGKNTVKTNFFESLPKYSSTWEYISQGKDAVNPLPLETIKTDGTLFSGYDYRTMAGTWTVKAEGDEFDFTAVWDGCFPYSGSLVLPFTQVSESDGIWIQNHAISAVDFPFSAEKSDFPEYMKLESLSCTFEALTEEGDPEQGICTPDNIHVPAHTKAIITGGEISFEECPGTDNYRLTFMRQVKDAFITMVIHIERPKFPEHCGILPSTGFSSKHITNLSVRPENITYKSLSMSLQIPVLNVETDLVSIPFINNSWPVEWLGDKAGVMEGSSLPGKGYSLIAAHNTLNNTEYGPFALLSTLDTGDIIYVKDKFGEILRFSVYANKLVDTDGFAAIEAAASEVPGSLILLTCENESIDGTYLNRRVVFARPEVLQN